LPTTKIQAQEVLTGLFQPSRALEVLKGLNEGNAGCFGLRETRRPLRNGNGK